MCERQVLTYMAWIDQLISFSPWPVSQSGGWSTERESPLTKVSLLPSAGVELKPHYLLQSRVLHSPATLYDLDWNPQAITQESRALRSSGENHWGMMVQTEERRRKGLETQQGGVVGREQNTAARSKQEVVLIRCYHEEILSQASSKLESDDS